MSNKVKIDLSNLDGSSVDDENLDNICSQASIMRHYPSFFHRPVFFTTIHRLLQCRIIRDVNWDNFVSF